MQWAVVIAAFLAAAVEFVEAFTLVLVAGITANWRSAIVGALAPLRGGSGLILIVGVLATLVATLGREVMRPKA